MPNGTVPRYSLRGRVVTMAPTNNQDFLVIDDGVVYVDGRVIKKVLRANQPAPAGFENVPAIQTNGTIYPGMIELHNHLSYDILPLWDVPKQFDRRDQWSRHPEKGMLVTGPMQVLGHSQGFPEAIARYVEAKCLLAGVTTSQGLKLSGVGIDKYYKGIVRNVEQRQDQNLRGAATRIPDVDADDIQSFFNRLSSSSCLLLHLSEGVDDRSRDAFRALQMPNGNWAITDALAGIHCAALLPEHFQILHDHGGSMIWSPLSNLLLYRKTADIQAAKAAGMNIALGSDWSPSGSKNLLGELKAARLVSQQLGGLFTPKELAAMVTINPARIVKWHTALGSLQEDFLADLIVLQGSQGDPYEQLIEATETAIAMVVIDGEPRYWRTPLPTPFSPGTEQVRVGGELRSVNLNDPNANLNVQGLTIEAARQRLQDGLRRLPELALDLENSIAMGGAVGFDPITNQSFPTLVLDEDELQTESQRPLLGGDAIGELQDLLQLLAGVRYSELLQGVVIELDPLTVVDDPRFFSLLAGQVNLTFEFKQGLADFYGAQLPLPDGGGFIRRTQRSVRSQFWTVRDLPSFRSKSGYLSLADRRLIVDQALVLLERVYVHLPFKRAMHAIDPVQRLKLLQYSLEQLQFQLEDNPQAKLPPEIDFHKEMTSIFTSLRDLHTNYLLPEPYRDKVAFLPFLVEEYFDDQTCSGGQRYIVSKILPGVRSKTFAEGVELLYWNGIPIQQAVALNGERQSGGNPDARLARGLESLTIRPLIRSLPPDEEWVSLRFRAHDGKEREFRQKWLLFSLESSAGEVDADSGLLPATALGVDLQADAINQTKKLLYAPDAVAAEKVFEETRVLLALQHPTQGNLTPSTMPTVFRANLVTNDLGSFGYIRIFTFNVADDNAFVAEFGRLVDELAQVANLAGLIIDVRNNGGGLIYAAERLLQVLSAQRIEPERTQFINTALTLEICRRHRPSPLFTGLDLKQWVRSIEQAVETGAAYSLGFPITPPEAFGGIAQKFSGAMVLITDALCYSATDMFAAGFQDHKIGKILGTSSNTGAGGANVWTHALLDRLLRDPAAPLQPLPGSPFRPLPFGAGMRVAVRRTLRVGDQAGIPVEDLGVAPDYRYCMMKDDLLNGNRGLIRMACEILIGSQE